MKKVQAVLKMIGRPFFWLLLALIYLLTGLASLLSGLLLWPFKQAKIFFSRPRRVSFKAKPLRRSVAKPLSETLIKTEDLRFSPSEKPKAEFPFRWVFVFGFFLFCTAFYLFLLKDLPNPDKLITRQQPVSTKIYDRQGQLLYKVYRSHNRSLAKLKELPDYVIQSTLAIEDAGFFRHHGFSLSAITRSIFKNLTREKLYGGSTITQQLVKNALLTPERTIQRKAKEIILALLVEAKFSKDEILQMYLNEVGYGGAAYGVEEAAQMYFGKAAQDLNLPEAALLAGLPASPTKYSPFGAHPEKAKERQALVLKRMREEGFITAEEEKRAFTWELVFAPQKTDIQAPHFVMFVKDWLVKKYGEQMVEEGGLQVTTTLDLALHHQVQKIVTEEIDSLTRYRVKNGAAMVTSPATGEILSMVGSRDYFDIENDGNVNVALQPRQPGSSIKPINYSLALESGFTTATPINDSPITYHVFGSKPYSPRNYDNRFHGSIPLRVALASSYNVPAVKVLAQMGVQNMVERGREMGITTWEDSSRFGLSLTLGGGEVKLIDMSTAYGTFANLGVRVDLNPILEIRDSRGKVLEKFNVDHAEKMVFDPHIAYLMTDILSDNKARTPAFGPRSSLVIDGHPHVAVKTGTTQNMRDNWTIGYSPDFLVGVWVGNNDNTPMSHVASGVTGASPIWHDIMTLLLTNIPDKAFAQPEDVKKVQVCTLTGTLPCSGCPRVVSEVFRPGTEPTKHCTAAGISRILMAATASAEPKDKENENN